MKGVDPDHWSYFEAVGIVKKFKYDADFKLWWKGSKQKLMNNLRILSDDKEALYLANYAEENKEEVEIYVQHVRSEVVEVQFLTCDEEADEGNIEEMEKVVSKVGDEEINLHHEEVPEIVEEGGMGLEVGDGAKEYHSEEEECDGGEEQDYLHEEEEGGNVVEEEVEASAATWLDDSEEERMTNDDDGFGVENDWVDQVRRNINPVLDRWNRMKEKKKRVSRRDNVGEGRSGNNRGTSTAGGSKAQPAPSTSQGG
ncbi:uncharacterized protein HKW66_Vig0202780 [Vigna angularis]|uniref:PB1-like domain-containing protein n=1 Tax=Phaseolus angularis TaxID=3914 RepID=A0A8T0JRM6_PHAAN|nr:uncharacterized protein HKW66_Vig0202780 [Vigna angularis]